MAITEILTDVRALYRTACHGDGAEPRREARMMLRALAHRIGLDSDAALVRDSGLDLGAYFASRPIC